MYEIQNKRNIKVILVVDPGKNPNMWLEEAVCEYFKKIGWNASMPLTRFTDDVIILECPEVIPKLEQ